MNTKGQMGFDRPREVLRPSHRVDVQWPGRGHARLLGHVRPGASMTLPVGSMRGA